MFVTQLKAIPRSEEVLFESQKKLNLLRRGLPAQENFEVFYSTGEEIFRHFSDQKGIESILKAKKLIAGHKSSNLSDAHTTVTYSDITGIFMTTTKVAESGGLGFVDFKIPRGIPVLHIKEFGGDEFVVLGHKKWRDWFLDEINKDPNRYPSQLPLLKLKEDGTYIPRHTPLELPIEIVDTSLI